MEFVYVLDCSYFLWLLIKLFALALYSICTAVKPSQSCLKNSSIKNFCFLYKSSIGTAYEKPGNWRSRCIRIKPTNRCIQISLFQSETQKKKKNHKSLSLVRSNDVVASRKFFDTWFPFRAATGSWSSTPQWAWSLLKDVRLLEFKNRMAQTD